MANFIATCEDLVIASGQTSSRVVTSALETADSSQINIQSPGTLPDTVTIQVSHDNSTWATLYDGTADVGVPPAGKGSVYDNISFPYWKLVAGSAVAANRTFKLSKLYNAY